MEINRKFNSPLILSCRSISKNWTRPKRLFDHGLKMIYFRFIFGKILSVWIFTAYNIQFFLSKKAFPGFVTHACCCYREYKDNKDCLGARLFILPILSEALVILVKDLFKIYIRTWTSGNISFLATFQNFEWVLNDIELYCCNKDSFIFQSLKNLKKPYQVPPYLINF